MAKDNPESSPVICYLAMSLDKVGQYNHYDLVPNYAYPEYDKRALKMYNKCEKLGGLNDELKVKRQEVIDAMNKN